jgi:hypothetical protein
MAAVFNKYYTFVQDLAQKVHNLSSDALSVSLSNSTPDPVNHKTLSQVAEITPGNGYNAGGVATSIVSCVQTGGILKLILNNAVFAASGGTVGPFRYAVLYNATPSAKPLIAFFDYGASTSLNDTETFTVVFDPVNGVLTIQ